MENNIRRVPPPPPPRPNIPPRPPQYPLDNDNTVSQSTPIKVESSVTQDKGKGLNSSLRLTLLILGAVLSFIGMAVSAYFLFV